MNAAKEKITRFILNVLPMPQQQAETISGLFKEKDFDKNDIVFKHGKICNEYYYLEDGYMRAYTYDLEENDVTTAFYSSNQIVCELFSFFKRIPSKESIQALTDCKCWYITFDELQMIFHTMPEFREFGRTILINAIAGLKQRMLSTLHETAEERYSNLLLSNPEIFQHAPLKNIASFLGITDTSLSRIRKEFAKR
jgi:CRP-like cAMP-binding protein